MRKSKENWTSMKTDRQVLEKFCKMVRIKREQRRLSQKTSLSMKEATQSLLHVLNNGNRNLEQRSKLELYEQLNLVSVINNPDAQMNLAAVLASLYDRISLSQLLEYFYSKASGENISSPSALLDNETLGLIQKSLKMVRSEDYLVIKDQERAQRR
jgi:hypothetical protein